MNVIFFDYKDQLPDYIYSLNKKLVLRLHPLGLTDYINQGLISSKQFDLYVQKLDNYGFVFDNSNDSTKMYMKTSVLISDFLQF